MPVQERSIETVAAIHEATIQVLIDFGPEKLTTIRVAERAGVSVGTLYQYFPHKQALLYAALQTHLTTLAEAVEQACLKSRGLPVRSMVENVVNAFMRVKIRAREKSAALYRVSPQFRDDALLRHLNKRLKMAIAAMLRSAQVVPDEQAAFAALMFVSAITGASATLLGKNASASALEQALGHLVIMLMSYLEALSEAAPL